jgi:GTP cyclohydrolase III
MVAAFKGKIVVVTKLQVLDIAHEIDGDKDVDVVVGIGIGERRLP